MDFEFINRLPLEPFDQDDIDRFQLSHKFIQWRFRVVPVFMQKNPALAGGHEDLSGAGLPVLVRIFAGLVDIELVVCVLDGGHA